MWTKCFLMSLGAGSWLIFPLKNSRKGVSFLFRQHSVVRFGGSYPLGILSQQVFIECPLFHVTGGMRFLGLLEQITAKSAA